MAIFYGQSTLSQNANNDFDIYFPLITVDTLHIHPELIHKKNEIKLAGQYLKDNNKKFYPITSFYLGKDRLLKMYILKTDKGSVYILALNLKSGENIYFEDIAVHEIHEGAYEIRKNAIIADFDGDGYLDIGIIKRLTDFEMEASETSNISNEEKYLVSFKNNTYKYTNWEYNFYSNFSLIPERN